MTQDDTTAVTSAALVTRHMTACRVLSHRRVHRRRRRVGIALPVLNTMIPAFALRAEPPAFEAVDAGEVPA